MNLLNIRRILPLLVIILCFVACTDDLDQVNPNALTLDTYWQNTGDLNSGLNTVYASLRDENVLAIEWDYTRTDIATPYIQRQRSVGNPIYDMTFDLTTDQVQNKWDACFRGIFRANQVIDAYENLEETFVSEEAQKSGTNILAQARALRGYFYYVLHHSYNGGSLPLFDSVPKEFEDFQLTFSSAEEILAFYRADLEFGLANLPSTYNDWQQRVGSGNLGRITGGFCEALIAKSYINENDFTSAAPRLLSVIENYGYKLVDDAAEVLTGIAEFGSESIFEINYSYDANPLGLNEQNLSQRLSHRLNDGNAVQYSTWLTLKYRAERPDPLDPANYVDRNIYLPNGNLDSIQFNVLRMYSLRMNNSMSTVDDRDGTMYGVAMAEYGRATEASPHARQFPNFVKKFTSWNVNNGGIGEIETADRDNRSEINIPIMRLAEVYLLYAECMIEKGDMSEALRYINRVRKRSHLILLGSEAEASAEFVDGSTTYMDDIDMDSSNGLEAVNLNNLMDHLRFTEKPLELSLEGDRTIDLRRWGVWKERLDLLASFEYDAWHFKNNSMGNSPNRWRSFATISGEEPSYDDPNLPPFAFRFPNNLQANNNRRAKESHLRDHLRGSKNFNPDLHYYLPVPQDEINSNLNWDGN